MCLRESRPGLKTSFEFLIVKAPPPLCTRPREGLVEDSVVWNINSVIRKIFQQTNANWIQMEERGARTEDCDAHLEESANPEEGRGPRGPFEV